MNGLFSLNQHCALIQKNIANPKFGTGKLKKKEKFTHLSLVKMFLVKNRGDYNVPVTNYIYETHKLQMKI